jgi:hypothetical protein
MGGFVKSYLNAIPRPSDRSSVMGYYDQSAVPVFDFLLAISQYVTTGFHHYPLAPKSIVSWLWAVKDRWESGFQMPISTGTTSACDSNPCQNFPVLWDNYPAYSSGQVVAEFVVSWGKARAGAEIDEGSVRLESFTGHSDSVNL